MAAKKRTWLWIVFGIAICMALCVVALVAGGVYFVSQHVKTELVGRMTAEEQFQSRRKQFEGQQPLIELKRAETADVETRVHRSPESAPSVELKTLRVLVYDGHEGRLVHVELPFWLVRLMPPGSLNKTGGSDFSFDSDHVTVGDIERHGPGLILDAKDTQGAQVLIWAE